MISPFIAEEVDISFSGFILVGIEPKIKAKELCPDAYLDALFGRGYSESTIKTYFSLMGRFIRHSPIEQLRELEELIPLKVNIYHSRWLAGGNASAGTINQVGKCDQVLYETCIS